MVNVAKAQNDLCWIILFCAILHAGTGSLVTTVGHEMSLMPDGPYFYITLSGLAIMGLLQAVGAHRLLSAMRKSPGDVFLGTLIAAVPALGWIMLVFDNVAASKELRAHVRVGIMGVSESEMRKLIDLANGEAPQG